MAGIKKVRYLSQDLSLVIIHELKVPKEIYQILRDKITGNIKNG